MVRAFPSWALVFDLPVSQDVQQRALRKHKQWKQDKAREAALQRRSRAEHDQQRQQQQQLPLVHPVPAPTAVPRVEMRYRFFMNSS